MPPPRRLAAEDRSPPMSSPSGMRAGPVVLDRRSDRRLHLPQGPSARVRRTSIPKRSAPARGGIPTQLLDAGSVRGAVLTAGHLPIDRPVVIYSAGETHNIDATFLAWLLAGFGHRRCSCWMAAIFKWQLEQRPVVQRVSRLAETRLPRPTVPAGAGLAGGCRSGRSRGDGACWSMLGRRISTRARPVRRCATGTFPGPSITTGRTI